VGWMANIGRQWLLFSGGAARESFDAVDGSLMYSSPNGSFVGVREGRGAVAARLLPLPPK
jgi:hypothetical protein